MKSINLDNKATKSDFVTIFLNENDFLLKTTKENRDAYLVKVSKHKATWITGKLVNYAAVSKSTGKTYYSISLKKDWEYNVFSILEVKGDDFKLTKTSEVWSGQKLIDHIFENKRNA